MNINNLLGDLKTPDKCVFDFNSNVSGNKTLDKFHLVKDNINNNYFFFIKRIGNYYKKNFIEINKTYNIWDSPDTFNNIKKCINDIKKKYGNDINLKIYHLCVPIKLNSDCIYYIKELKDIHSELNIDYIMNNPYKYKGNKHNGDFSSYIEYGRYSWEYINNL